jgi:fucose permease
MPRRTEVGLVYCTALIQGLALVTFPAASSIFTSAARYGFSASRYGMLFIPQVCLAILAGSLAPSMARRWHLKSVLRAGMSADLLSMILLAVSSLLAPHIAYGALLVATACLGFGFGSVVMSLNTYAQQFSPGREDRAVLSLNALLGAGTALAPLLVALFLGLGAWWLLPVLVAIAMLALLLFSASQPLQSELAEAGEANTRVHLPPRFRLFAAAILLYGIAETVSGNWSGLYLTAERGLSAQQASFALTAFWATVTGGRILFAALSSKTTARWIYAGLPLMLIFAFEAIVRVRGVNGGILAFALAGLGCSAFLPLCISLSGRQFPSFAAVMSGQLIAFYQVGYGIAAFGVGPLRDLTGRPLEVIYSAGTLVAAAMFVLAFATIYRTAARLPRART